MSDYLFMLESHLTPAQREAVTAVEAAAGPEDQVFLVGGAMRDMLGGFPITDLDFAVQGNALELARTVMRNAGAEMIDSDRNRKTAELRFPNGVTAEVGLARNELFSGKPGSRPVVKPASIHDDLLRRDFTMNSIALSLHRASRGLLLDPSNGLADLEHRELRANSAYAFYDDPVRLLRFVRFRVRFGFTVHERTQQQYDNARAAQVEASIASRALFAELRAIAGEAHPGEILTQLDRENLLSLFSPALRGPKMNLSLFARLEKARQIVPHGFNLNLDNLGLFLTVLTEKLTPKEKSDLVRSLDMQAPEIEVWQKLAVRSRGLEKGLTSTKLHRPSEVYRRLREAPGDQILYLYLYSKERIVHNRIRNYLQKYLSTAMELADRDVVQLTGLESGDPRFSRFKQEILEARLDGRKWAPPKDLQPPAAEAAPSALPTEAPRPADRAGRRGPRRVPAARRPVARPAEQDVTAGRPPANDPPKRPAAAGKDVLKARRPGSR